MTSDECWVTPWLMMTCWQEYIASTEFYVKCLCDMVATPKDNDYIVYCQVCAQQPTNISMKHSNTWIHHPLSNNKSDDIVHNYMKDLRTLHPSIPKHSILQEYVGQDQDRMHWASGLPIGHVDENG